MGIEDKLMFLALIIVIVGFAFISFDMIKCANRKTVL